LRYSPTNPFPQPASSIFNFNLFYDSEHKLPTRPAQILGGNPALTNYSSY
jgi:hypothetical protein